MTQTLKASVKYGDMHGSTVADNAHMKDYSQYLEDKELLNNDNEFIIGFKVSIGELHGKFNGKIDVSYYIVNTENIDGNIPDYIRSNDNKVDVREIVDTMNINDFLALFKRFSFTLSPLNDIDFEMNII